MREIMTFFTILVLSSQISYAAVTDTNHVHGLTLDAVNNLNAIVTSLFTPHSRVPSGSSPEIV